MDRQPMYEIIPIENSLHVVCVTCRGTCSLDYKGLESSIPMIEITCPVCGSSGKWKLEQAGPGFHRKAKASRAGD